MSVLLYAKCYKIDTEILTRFFPPAHHACTPSVSSQRKKKVVAASRFFANTKAIELDENLGEVRRDRALEFSKSGAKN